jgi:hypothetical protein
MDAPSDLIAVATFDTVAEAAVVQALLEADGIRVHASNSGLVGLDWSFSQALGGVRLLVPSARVAESRALVDAYRRGDLAAVDDVDSPPAAEVCPRCGSARVVAEASTRQKGLLVVLTLGFGAMFPTRATRRSCRDCGHRWSENAMGTTAR